MSYQEKDARWEKEIVGLLERFPAIGEFLDTWMAGSGSKHAFRGQTCVMVKAVLATASQESFAANPLELMQALCPSLEEDFLMALRFLYYVKHKPVVPDLRYDEAEKEFLARPDIDDSPLMNPGSDNPADYPDHIKALGFYLSLMGWKAGQVAPALQPVTGELF